MSHSLFLWLKGRNGGGRTVPTSLPVSEVEAGMALLTSFGLKPLILTSFKAAGWQLIHVVGVVPRTGASGRTPGQVREPAPASATQFQSSGQMWHTPSLGLQQQEREQQHSPGKWEEAGGGTVTDAMQNLRLRVVCKVRAKALR